jgi:dihydrofolate reductase
LSLIEIAMRRLVYGVAASLDGFIAGPHGEVDWILPNSGIDFRAIYSKYDTLLMGHRTYEVASTRGDILKGTGMRVVVVSTTLGSAHPAEITVVNRDVAETIRALKTESGKDMWLMGGSVLFRCLLDVGLVDAIDVCVFPVLLGAGTPLLREGQRAALQLEECKALASGVLMLSYSIPNPQSVQPRPV